MAKKDARIRFLERELAEREREMETMTIPEQPMRSEVDDERLRDLERKVQNLEALVKGLTAEILDLKSVTMNLYRDMEGRRVKPAAPERKAAADAARAEPRIGAGPRVYAEPRVPERPVEARPPGSAAPEENLDLIMQTDGTLKPEPRKPSEYIIASTKTVNAPAKIRGKGAGSSDRTLFVEQKKRKVNDVIQAEEGDTLDLDR
ncbi:MAG: hypothetical protein GX885_00930 [Methanomicrobiales archaeon]|nr:hypothetical protein [Methanomicrobiales archaeon]